MRQRTHCKTPLAYLKMWKIDAMIVCLLFYLFVCLLQFIVCLLVCLLDLFVVCTILFVANHHPLNNTLYVCSTCLLVCLAVCLFDPIGLVCYICLFAPFVFVCYICLFICSPATGHIACLLQESPPSRCSMKMNCSQKYPWLMMMDVRENDGDDDDGEKGGLWQK